MVYFAEAKNLNKDNLNLVIDIKSAHGEESNALRIIDQPWYTEWKSDRTEYLIQYHRRWLKDQNSRREPPVALGLPINKLRDEDFSRNPIKVFGSSETAHKINGLFCEIDS